MLLIRAATVNDVPLLKKFFRELAKYEREPNAVVVTEETLIKDGFGSQPKFRGLIAEWDGRAIGYTLFFGFYSSWKGSGIFLEDLFVGEPFRGRGIGRALLSEVARIARQEGCYGIRWEVLGWNESAIEFYKSLGGKFMDEWRQVLLEAEALNRLADGQLQGIDSG
jgi:GNAT superfamily N-acetyltransferase